VVTGKVGTDVARKVVRTRKVVLLVALSRNSVVDLGEVVVRLLLHLR